MYEPEETGEVKKKAFLVGLAEGQESNADVREHLLELSELVCTQGLETCGELCVSVREIHPRYYVGSGKAGEISEAAAQCQADVIIFDSPLGPSQQRNLEKLCGRHVIDRQEVILDIFAQRAWTREAVLQVELARSRYFLPRLTGAWSHLSRQRGGGGTVVRGAGEKQLESDRRLLKQKIAELEEELAEVRKQRAVQRKSRIRSNVPQAAIVGYTNVGKSTLLNTLTGSEAFAANQLFATLDPTTRHLTLPDRSELLLTDTVGFIRKLPHSLVEAFKSTLEEAVLADFIVLVLDASSPAVTTHWETTLSVLSELGADQKDMLVVFNKMDLTESDPLLRLKLRSIDPEAVFVSCQTGEGLDDLKQKFMRKLAGRSMQASVRIPPGRGDLIALLHASGKILESHYAPEGDFYAAVRIPGTYRKKLEPYMIEQNTQHSLSERR